MEFHRAAVTAGQVQLFDNPDMVVTLTNPQKQSLLANEVSLQQSIKNISGAWAV